MNLDSLYVALLLKKNPDLDIMICDKDKKRISEYEEKFKNVHFFKREVYEQPAKYYLQNKIKKNTNDIQDTLRRQIDNLNNTYEDNMYFIDIGKEILNKEENKHIYNIYKVSVIEYKKINLYDDFLLESDDFYDEKMRPIYFSNPTDDLKVFLYELINDTLNYSEIYANYNTIDDVEMKHYNTYFKYLKNTILEFFLDLFSNNEKINEIKALFDEIEPHITCTTHIPIYNTLNRYYNVNKHKKNIERIIELVIELGWSIDMGILNINLLNERIQEL